MQNDNLLIRRFINGEQKAFEVLFEKYKLRVFNKIISIVKDSEQAQDILQETFVKALDTIRKGKYNEEGKFYPWLMRIAHNKAIDFYRKAQRYPVFVPDEGHQFFSAHMHLVDSQEETLIKQDTLVLLQQSIAELPDSQQKVLIMRNFMGMSFQEIADETGVSINTALGRMRYALTNLRKKMIRSSVAENTAISA
ncbi:MAG: sigma-70 family RNA polymerase sigma factor [Cytophagales bacterium]|nr:sigma-70 family RNA polymerase sigma factor [Cytophagales bacterium]